MDNAETPVISPEQTRAQKQYRMEHAMRRVIAHYSLFFMVLAPVLISWGLKTVSLYIDNDLSVYYDTTAVTALAWVVYYTLNILSTLYQYGAFAVVGYSVMRYGLGKSVFPMLMCAVCATISYSSNIWETVYSYGSSTVLNNLSYFVTLWVINYLLFLFTYACVIALCCILRVSFLHRGRLAVGITHEERMQRKRNVMRHLFVWIAVLVYVFNLITAATQTVMEIIECGGPETFWEWFTLLEPHVELVLYALLGYFWMTRIGMLLTRSNDSIREKEEEAA